MKRKKLILLLVAEAVLLCAVMALTQAVPSMFSSILAFPLEPVALGLKAAAKTGPVGNGFAVMVSAALILLPLFFAFRTKGEEKKPERFTLVLLAAAILIGLYGAWNPGAFQNRIVPGTGETDRTLQMLHVTFSLTIWGILVLFIVLRLIRLFRVGHREQLLRYLRWILITLCFFLTASFALTLSDGVLSLIKGKPTGADTALFVIKTLVTLATALLEVAVSLRMLDLLDTANHDEQEGLAEAAGRLSHTSCTALACTAGFTVVLHIIQIILLPHLTDAQFHVELPIRDIFFVLVILLLSRLMIENKELKDDNSMFI